MVLFRAPILTEAAHHVVESNETSNDWYDLTDNTETPKKQPTPYTDETTDQVIFPSNHRIVPHQSLINTHTHEHAALNTDQQLITENEVHTQHIHTIDVDCCIQTVDQIISDIKVLVQSSNTDFDTLCLSYCNNYSVNTIQHRVFELIRMLYESDTQQLDQLTVSDDTTALSRQLSVKHAVSEWLQQICTDQLKVTIQSTQNNLMSHVLCLLVCHRISDACSILTSQIGQYHELLLLLSQIGQSYTTQHDVAAQLKQYTLDNTIDTMTREEIIIYKLIAGDVPGVAIALVKLYHISWINVFALYVWYNKSTMYHTLTDAMQAYTTLLQQHNNNELIAPYSLYGKQYKEEVFDILYSILALYCNTDVTLNTQLYQQIVFPSSYSLNLQDVHLAYHVHQVYGRISEDSMTDTAMTLAAQYAEQLQQINLWHVALYVASTNQLNDIKNRILHQYIQQLTLPIDEALAQSLYVDVELTQYHTCIHINNVSLKEQLMNNDNSELIKFICDAAAIDIEHLYNIKAQRTLQSTVDSTTINQLVYCEVYVMYLHAQQYTTAHHVFIKHIISSLILSQNWSAIHTQAERLQSYLDATVYRTGIGLYVNIIHTINIDAHNDNVSNLNEHNNYHINDLNQLQAELQSMCHPFTDTISKAATQYLCNHLNQLCIQLQSMSSTVDIRMLDRYDDANQIALLDVYVNHVVHTD